MHLQQKRKHGNNPYSRYVGVQKKKASEEQISRLCTCNKKESTGITRTQDMWACKKRKQAKNKYPGYAPAIKKEARAEPVLRLCGRAKKESKRRTDIQAMHLQ